MNREDIICMAKEAGFIADEADFLFPPKNKRVGIQLEIERFAALVASAEREKFCSKLRQLHDSYSLVSDSSAIRARGQA